MASTMTQNRLSGKALLQLEEFAGWLQQEDESHWLDLQEGIQGSGHPNLKAKLALPCHELV
jgi:hypothetical protein